MCLCVRLYAVAMSSGHKNLLYCSVVRGDSWSQPSGEFVNSVAAVHEKQLYCGSQTSNMMYVTAVCPDVSHFGDLQPLLFIVFSQLHEVPGLSFEKTAISALVHAQLQQQDTSSHAGSAKTGLIACIGDGTQ